MEATQSELLFPLLPATYLVHLSHPTVPNSTMAGTYQLIFAPEFLPYISTEALPYLN